MCRAVRTGSFLALGILAILVGQGVTNDSPRTEADLPAFDIRLIEPGTSPIKAPAAEKPAAAAEKPAPVEEKPVPVESKPAPAEEKVAPPVKGDPQAAPTTTQPASPLVKPAEAAPPAASAPREIAPKKLEVHDAAGSAKPAAEELKPIAEEPEGPVTVEVASFKGVTPGVTTVAELEKTWGQPRELHRQAKGNVSLYTVDPFPHVEVTSHGDTVVAIGIRFAKSFPATAVAKQLGLSRIRPVLVSNELGEILGQAYPERGVLLAFEPAAEAGKASMKVSQIIIEPLCADTFVLRAETVLDSQPVASLEDLQQAIKLQPRTARAQWLKARILSDMADFDKALNACDEALRVDPDNPQYHVTRAQILGQSGRVKEAVEEAERAVETASRRPHVKARALCLLGDLWASDPLGDYKRAMEFHMKAIGEADTLASDQYPAIRLAAKEVLVDAHLGAAQDIAWGNWKDKEKALDRWLERAKVLIDDLISNDAASEVYRLRLSTRALAACVGARGVIDPGPWTEQALHTGRSLIAGAEDPLRKAQYQWDLGMALYDALQVYQLRGEHDTAMKYGEMAIDYLEKGQPSEAPRAAYLLGRLYFRMGAVYALRDQNHRAATSWFEKAVPLLERPLPHEAGADVGRHGETFVSMGVSFWETGRRDRALEITQRGVEFMEQAVKQGLLAESSLAVGYGNLATMNRALGQREAAARLEEQAARVKSSATR